MFNESSLMEESTLVARAGKGDHQAFRTLYERHVDALYRFLKQFSGDRQEVEDWVQRSFIRAFRSLDRFQGRSRFGTWLFAIGLNEMRTDKRKAGMVLMDGPPDEAWETVDSADAFEWDDLMRNLLSRLDENKRAVFLLYEIEGFSHAEIAEMLGIGESASRTILARTKHALREQWNRERKAAG